MIAFQVIGSLILLLGGLVLGLQLLKKYVPSMAGPRDLVRHRATPSRRSLPVDGCAKSAARSF